MPRAPRSIRFQQGFRDDDQKITFAIYVYINILFKLMLMISRGTYVIPPPDRDPVYSLGSLPKKETFKRAESRNTRRLGHYIDHTLPPMN